MTDEPDYLREYEHVTLARALVGAGDRTAAGFLERLLTAAEAGGRQGTSLEILVLLAVARKRQGDIGAAMDALSRALELGEPEGYARTFTDEGPTMASLLTGAAKRGVTPSYATQLLGSTNPAPRESARAAFPQFPAPHPHFPNFGILQILSPARQWLAEVRLSEPLHPRSAPHPPPPPPTARP